MGFWSTPEKLMIGDGPVDLAHDCLEAIALEYEEDMGRKPTIEEVFETFLYHLRENAEVYCHKANKVQIASIKIKYNSRPKKMKMKVGDIVRIPMASGYFAFAQVPPELYLLDYFRVKSKKTPFHLRRYLQRKDFKFKN